MSHLNSNYWILRKTIEYYNILCSSNTPDYIYLCPNHLEFFSDTARGLKKIPFVTTFAKVLCRSPEAAQTKPHPENKQND